MNEIWSLDECHFQQHGSRCTMWIPPEQKDPVVMHAPTRKSVSLFGAVNLSTGKLIHIISPIFNASTFLDFLMKLSEHGGRKKKLYIILDNARYHHAELIQQYLSPKSQRLELLFLPPYSPELNPIERVWKLTRRNKTHNQYFPSLDCLINNVKEQLLIWKTPNEVLSRLYCII